MAGIFNYALFCFVNESHTQKASCDLLLRGLLYICVDVAILQANKTPHDNVMTLNAYKSGKSIVVTYPFIFMPSLCPCCLAPQPKHKVKISACHGKIDYSSFSRRYRTRSIKFPYCEKCARRIKLTRLAIWACGLILLILPYTIAPLLGLEDRWPLMIFSFTFYVIIGIPCLLAAKALGIRYDRGVSIISSADDSFNQFLFDNPIYEDEFLKKNL
jgi:hypothetical protein